MYWRTSNPAPFFLPINYHELLLMHVLISQPSRDLDLTDGILDVVIALEWVRV